MLGDAARKTLQRHFRIKRQEETMGLLDEMLRDKGKVGIESHVGPQQVTAEKIQDGTIPAGDIANNAVTEAKIAAAAITGGLIGGGGTKLAVAPDGSSVELNAGTARLKDAGVLAMHLAAAVKGAGLVQSVGGLNIDADMTTLDFQAGTLKLQCKDLGVSKAKLASDAKRHLVGISLLDFTATQTVRYGISGCTPTAGVSYKLISATLAAYTIPISAGGVCHVALNKRDVSAAADVNVVSGVDANSDAETLTPKVGRGLTVITAADANVLDYRDTLFIDLISDAAIGTPWAGACLTLEFEEI